MTSIYLLELKHLSNRTRYWWPTDAAMRHALRQKTDGSDWVGMPTVRPGTLGVSGD